MSIVLRPFHPNDLAIYRSWFDHAGAADRISPPDEAWLRHVTNSASGNAWIASDGRHALAVVQADWDATATAFLFLIVAPSHRGRGIGREVLRAWLAGEGRDFRNVEGRVEPGNIASLQCALHCGFQLVNQTPDEEGFLHLRLTRCQ